jgi:hypothetical protein
LVAAGFLLATSIIAKSDCSCCGIKCFCGICSCCK